MMNKNEVLLKLEELDGLLSSLETKLEESFKIEKESLILNQVNSHDILEKKIRNIELKTKTNLIKLAKKNKSRHTVRFTPQEIL